MTKKILIVDDEEDLVEMTAFRLKAAGFDVAEAFNGKAGLKKAKEVKPDIILLDVMMPEMNGFEVAEHLHSDNALKDIPIIAFTAMGGDKLADKIAAMKAVDYIAKPFEAEELITKIKKVISRQS